ncbi:MAG: hypothetical protein JWO59_730 [Chloroflexi bacterium]|nr:hypothetical protein [Chloroflexota bacterium]
MPRYIANERMKIGPDTYREVGQPVPEAAGWNPGTREQYVRNGRLVAVYDTPEDQPAAPAKQARKEPAHA